MGFQIVKQKKSNKIYETFLSNYNKYLYPIKSKDLYAYERCI